MLGMIQGIQWVTEIGETGQQLAFGGGDMHHCPLQEKVLGFSTSWITRLPALGYLVTSNRLLSRAAPRALRTSKMKRRHQFWLMVMALVLGFGCYKSRENRSEAKEQVVWRDQIARLEAASKARFEELQTWTPELHKAADPKRQIADRLADGQPLSVATDGGHETITWRHPKYGIEMTFGFSNGILVSLGSTRSSGALEKATPRPPLYAHGGYAESFRRSIPPYAGIAWLVALGVAVLSRRFGLVAAESLVVSSLAYGTAWLVSPLYELSLQGILSNDSLFLAVLMYVVILSLLAFRLPNDSFNLVCERCSQSPAWSPYCWRWAHSAMSHLLHSAQE
jgi:hypothetical protein